MIYWIHQLQIQEKKQELFFFFFFFCYCGIWHFAWPVEKFVVVLFVLFQGHFIIFTLFLWIWYLLKWYHQM